MQIAMRPQPVQQQPQQLPVQKEKVQQPPTQKVQSSKKEEAPAGATEVKKPKSFYMSSAPKVVRSKSFDMRGPADVVKTISFTKDKNSNPNPAASPQQQQQQQGYYMPPQQSGGYGMPQWMPPMPSPMGHMMPNMPGWNGGGGYYCNTSNGSGDLYPGSYGYGCGSIRSGLSGSRRSHSRRGGRERGLSIDQSRYSRANSCGSLDDTYDSGDSFESLRCSSPMGRFIGSTINSFMDGMTNVLEYGEHICDSDKVGMASTKYGGKNGGPPTRVVVPTPHGENSPEDLTQKMDELLKLLKDKESGGTLASSPGKEEKQQDGNEVKTATIAKSEAETCVSAKADELIEKVRNTHLNPVKDLNGLNESAITKDSEMLGITNDLVLDPIVDGVVNESVEVERMGSKVLDELSFEFNEKGLSISGEAEPEATTTATESAEEKAASKPSLHAAAHAVKKEMKTSKVAGKDASKENQKTLDVDPSVHTKKASKSNTKPRRGMKQIFKDIKNVVPKEIKTKGRKSTSAKKATSKPTYKTTTVEDPKVEIEKEGRGTVEQQASFPTDALFATDFATETAVDSMGFPTPTSSSTSNTIKNGGSWESNFSGDGNPFAGQDIADIGSAVCGQVNKTTSAETRICAWCRKGGTKNPDVVKKLKLCSRCQFTYYCSSECQSKDWVKGHSTTCQPTSVAMY